MSRVSEVIFIFNIEPGIQDLAELVVAKLHFLLQPHKKRGQQKIDVVIRRAEFKTDLPIFRIAGEPECNWLSC